MTLVDDSTAKAQAFAALGLSEPVVHAVGDAGYEQPTPIQAQAIPQVLIGRDVLGCAQTGTGKTASFVLPLLDILSSGRARARMPRALILEPTRELAAQVADNFVKYGRHQSLSFALLIGGVSLDDQFKKLDRGVDVLIATPGRLIDHFQRGRVLLSATSFLVIDEADRMLDMGFIPDIERIVAMLPKSRQTLFFSATMPPEIRRLADAFLVNPREISVDAPSSTASTIEQVLVPYEGRDREKRATLRQVLNSEDIQNALIFCNRKRDVGLVYRSLKRHDFNVGELHGDMSQEARTATLGAFKKGEITILVASDVAARGLDIAAVGHVINYDAPVHAEDYVHRIGRTGRAGRSGKSFTIVGPADAKHVQAIERLIGRTIPNRALSGEPVESAPPESPPAPRSRRRRSRSAEEPRSASTGRDDRPERESEQPERNEAEQPEKKEEATAEPESRPRRTQRRDESAGSGERRQRGGRGRDRAPSQDDNTGGDSAAPGFGDHVPAFLLRALPEFDKDAKETA